MNHEFWFYANFWFMLTNAFIYGLWSHKPINLAAIVVCGVMMLYSAMKM